MTKNDVINFFRALPAAEPEQFNRALEMYRKSPAHNAGLVRQYNASGYSKTTLANLLYDLQQLWGIKDVEKLPVKVKRDPNQIISDALLKSNDTYALYGLKLLMNYSVVKDYLTTEELKTFYNDCEKALAGRMYLIQVESNIHDGVAIEVIIENIRNSNIEIALPEEFEKELAEIAAEIMPNNDESDSEDVEDLEDLTEPVSEEDKKKLDSLYKKSGKEIIEYNKKFREDYPFLQNKDCPVELKILAADKISAYHAYKGAHGLLEDIANANLEVLEDKKPEIAAQAVKAYEEGEAIKAELDYYRDNNKVLGKHPVFAELALKREIDSMSIEECHKEIKNAAPYISKKKKAIAKAKSEEEKAKLQAELKAREEKLKKVKQKLGIQ